MVKLSLSNYVLDNVAANGATGGPDFVRRKKPDWLRAKLPAGRGYQRLRAIIDEHDLHTVCESAKCPNMGECWSRGTATIMILGDTCTRSCGFCHIKTGRPPEYDTDEPRRVGEAAALMRLRHLVVTSVNRDELDDGGAAMWARTIREIRRQSPGTSVEVLIPDFAGDWDALQRVIDERPEILNHNLETVPRLYRVVRPQARYDRSIELLRRAKEQGLTVKTGIMVGIGEGDEEIEQLMRDVARRTRLAPQAGVEQRSMSDKGPDQACEEARHPSCDILTIGQYLQPTRNHLPINRWVTPEQFAGYKRLGESIGFRHVESGPLVRSSYHAEDQVLHLNDEPPRRPSTVV